MSFPSPSAGHAVSRDVFARFDTMQRRVYTLATCAECGQRKHTPKGHSFLFNYGTNRDDRGTTEWQPRFFCSVSCMRNYYC